MLEVKIICIGKLKEKYWRDAVQEYTKRLSAFCRFSVVELSEVRVPQDPNDAQIEKVLEEEAKAVIAAVGRSTAYALCIEGKMLSSEKLASEIESEAVSGTSSMAFIIGSSHGLHESVKRLGKRISMSPMTFPHQLARIMLLEQIYRSFRINSGGKYHK